MRLDHDNGIRTHGVFDIARGYSLRPPRAYHASRIFILLLAASSVFGAATPIRDTLHRADGSVCNGSLAISWNTFVSVTNETIFGGQTQSQIKNGMVSLSLEPYGPYSVSYIVGASGCVPHSETWFVPACTVPVPIRLLQTPGSQCPSTGGIQWHSITSTIWGNINPSTWATMTQ